MAEYIERDAAIRIAEQYGLKCCTVRFWYSSVIADMIADDLEDLPTADVAAVRHGRWNKVVNPAWPAYSHDKCSICGWWNTKNAQCYDGGHKPGHGLNYCPNCGAMMDLEADGHD